MKEQLLKTVQETLQFLQEHYALPCQIVAIPKNCQFFKHAPQAPVIKEEVVKPLQFVQQQYTHTKKAVQAPTIVEKSAAEPTPLPPKKEVPIDSFEDLFALVARISPKTKLIQGPDVILIASNNSEEAVFLERLSHAIATRLKSSSICKREELRYRPKLLLSFTQEDQPHILLEPIEAYESPERKRSLWSDLCSRLQ